MPGKIYDLSDLDNFELPPLPSKAKKETAGNPQNAAQASVPADNKGADIPEGTAPAHSEPVTETSPPQSAAAPSGDGFELPPLPVRKPESSDKSAASDVAAPTALSKSVQADIAADFELPPLPVRKPAPQAAGASQENASGNVSGNSETVPADDFDLPPLPAREPAENVPPEASAAATVSDSAENAFPESDFELPPLPVRETETTETADIPGEGETAAPEQDITYENPGDDFELPPLPEKKPEETQENAYEEQEQETYNEPDYVEAAPETEYIPESERSKPRVSLEDDLDIDLEGVTPEDIGIDDPSKALAPMHTAREAQARNVREKMKMEDLAMDLDTPPVLDDLSDEYAAPEKRAENLMERDHLESDEKQVLKQRLQEDLSRRPENFNARASRNMYNKLMEEKKLKIARKGMLISFIPIVMELTAAGICFFTMNWGTYQWLSYVAAFGAFGALLLLIKSKHTKMFSIIISAITVLAYAVPGLVLYAIDETMQNERDYIVRIVMAAAAVLLNVGAILILTKNEAVNTYYTAKFRRK